MYFPFFYITNSLHFILVIKKTKGWKELRESDPFISARVLTNEFIGIFNQIQINLDTTLKSLIDFTYWIDVCQSDGNLLASGGEDRNIKICDKRESKIVRTFDKIHGGKQILSIFKNDSSFTNTPSCLILLFAA